MSTVHKGTIYENWSMRVLQSCLSMSLSRVGGRADGGIDLQGWWWLPSHTGAEEELSERKRIRVLAQCKAEKKKIGPKYVREMEGVLHQFNAHASTSPPSTDIAKSNAVGLFISTSPFSELTLLRAQSSSLPLALLHLPLPAEQLVHPASGSDASQDAGPVSPDVFGSMIFNAALGSTSGVLKGEIEPRWEYPLRPGRPGRPMLWWRGSRMPNYLPQQDMDSST